jgi:hypothetical protein
MGLGFINNPSDFADSNHLNYWGAIHFSGLISTQIILPELQK